MSEKNKKTPKRPRVPLRKIEELPEPEMRSAFATDKRPAHIPLPVPKPAPPVEVESPPPEPIPEKPITAAHRADLDVTAVRAVRARKILAELAARKLDALALYEPLPVQKEFHASKCRMNLLRGSNRGGKTLPAAVEVARAVTGRDPHKKYPKKDGRFFCVGKDLAHIGQVMWRKLSRPGAFKIIRDLATGKWRSYRPRSPEDQVREEEAIPAPPLIPPRMIKDIAWESKKEEIPSVVHLTNGWEICFYSSLGKPPQGSDIDGFWFDEEIVDPAWLPEMQARVLDRRGRGIWSATPQAGTEQLYELHERARRERWVKGCSVREHVILLSENPHIREEDKKALAEGYSEEERRVRVDGDFAFISFRMYPEFSMLVHGVDRFEVPLDWCRYVVIDPGHQRCAVLFAAIPPANDHCYIYDELYLKDCDAYKFAVNLASKTKDQQIQACIIDPNMAASTEVGSGKTVARQFTEALEREKFYAVDTGAGFYMGRDDRNAGYLAVHGWLRVRESGLPYLRIFRESCPAVEEEFKRYVRKVVGGVITDEANNRKWNHLMDCMRYLALHEPKYIKPLAKKGTLHGAVKVLKDKEARKRQASGGNYIRLGPGRVE